MYLNNVIVITKVIAASAATVPSIQLRPHHSAAAPADLEAPHPTSKSKAVSRRSKEKSRLEVGGSLEFSGTGLTSCFCQGPA